MKVVRRTELGSDHYLLMNINLKMERRIRGMERRMRQQIKINKLKDGEVRSKYQVIMSEMYEAYEGKRYWTEADVEMSWKEERRYCGGSEKGVWSC